MTPEFKICTDLTSEKLLYPSIETAVRRFTEESHCEDDKQGLYDATIECIANAAIFKQPGHYFWLSRDNNRCAAYALTHVGKDVDNKMCYWMTQAWISPKLRGSRWAKEALCELRNHAKQLLCSHIIVVSSRSTEAYLRFLGPKWHVYTTLLKEDI